MHDDYPHEAARHVRLGDGHRLGHAALGHHILLVHPPWENPPALDAAGLAAFFVLAFVGSFLAYMLYLQGVKDIGALKAGLIGTVEPVSATITSALLLGTVFSGTDIAGFAFIIIMVFLTV